MSAMFVGRVGGLAVALGVGAAAFQAAGVAWADTASPTQDQSSTTSTSSATSTSSGRHAATASPAAGHRGARTAAAPGARAGKAASSARAAAAAPRVRAAHPAQSTAGPAAARSVAADVANTEDAVDPSTGSAGDSGAAPVAIAYSEAPSDGSSATPVLFSDTAPEDAPVVGVLYASAGSADSSADGGSPAVPADTPLEWTVLSATRRDSTAMATAAPQVTSSYYLGGCSQTSTACTLIMGPSGVPVPTDTYGINAMNLYVVPNNPGVDYTAQLVFTPEGAYPATGIKVLPLTISAQQGQTILENTMSNIQPGPLPGDVPITVFGYSQSAVITSLLQRDMETELGLLPGVDRNTLNFVTVGNEMNPDGGWFARFPGFNTPPLGEYFFGSTPESAFPTTNYTLEYDGFADSPKYPINFISDLNAALGIVLVHINYNTPSYFAKTYGTVPGSLDPTMGLYGPGIACQSGSSTSCTALPSTDPTQKYYFISTPNLPLLAPLRAIPLIGKPLAALVQPVLKVIVDLGYADPAHGFPGTQAPANVASPFALWPNVSPKVVIGMLVDGVKQGVQDFISTLKGGLLLKSQPGAATPLASALKSLTQAQPGAISAGGILTTINNIIGNTLNRVGMGASALYASLLATADFINATFTSLPAYNLTIMTDSIKQMLSGQFIQGLTNFLGLPIAFDTGMIATISVIQLTVTLEAIIAALTGCGPAAPQAGMCIVPGL